MGRNVLAYPFDSELILKKKNSIRRDLVASEQPRIKKKIAILGGSTTDEIKKIMELFLLNEGIEPTFYETEFAQYWQESIFGDKLREFNPDVILIHTTCRNIASWPTLKDTREQVDDLLATQFSHFSSMWEKLELDLRCPIIQNNFERPNYRLLGNQDISDFHGRANFVSRLNQKFNDYAQCHGSFYINDIDYLSAVYGHDRWVDPLHWYMYKYALCILAIPDFAFSVANIIKSIYGKNKKALILDLDNTLWGGVAGDDGVENLTLGTESAIGEAFLEFQEYMGVHKDLGIILNVCSKNDHATAIAGLNHPCSILSPKDFASIKANWENKDDNIREIANELNIGAESMVFVDDNPAERAFVSEQIEGIAVPDIGNIENYIQRIDRSGFFEVTAFSEDDLNRNEMYMENAHRIRHRQGFINYEDYLKSLEMVATIQNFKPVYYQRIAQLANKSNQFNLTTKRYSESEIASIAADNHYIRLYGKLMDKFGDNGIVSVIIGRKVNTDLHIDLWLMSCRVLKRNMEYAMLDRLVEEAKFARLKKLIGYYYPTEKNGMVKEFYTDMGFKKTGVDNDGSTVWEYGVDLHVNKNSVIVINKN